MTHYRDLNRQVMIDTQRQYQSLPELQEAVRRSIERQYMVSHEDDLQIAPADDSHTSYIVSGKRSFEAAKAYVGKKVAVLNFANNHAIGGAPFSANAQEESLCRCSTLYPCLQAMKRPFYDKHSRMFEARQLGYMGNDDLIYTPDVVAFKTDERTQPIYPKMMPSEEWYKVDVITCAAPELRNMHGMPHFYEQQITSRIKKILDVAAKEKVEVLILGKWGCGAFRNPIEVVANAFMTLLKNYHFETVEFALASSSDLRDDAFARVCRGKSSSSTTNSVREEILALLQSTGRENINKVIAYLDASGFFESPASVAHHNNFQGGLAKHSLDVYRQAVELNKEEGLPLSSLILCSLLHDVCKADQYEMMDNQPVKVQKNIEKGHGRRSMFIVKRRCQLPLNYDEEMAIWWHMGEHEISKASYFSEYKISQDIRLCTLIQRADKLAATQS